MNHPDIFYKYMSAETAVKVLKTSKLRWSSPLLFNDPSEWQRMPCFSPTIEEAYIKFIHVLVEHVYGSYEIDEDKLPALSKLIIDILKYSKRCGILKDNIVNELTKTDFIPRPDEKVTEELRKFINSFICEARILCVTTEYDNESMWSHYTDNFCGCVLGFRHIQEKDTPLLAATKVIYSLEKPVVGSGLDFLLYGDTPELRKNTLEAIIFTKKTSWSYEKEWRVVTWTHHQNNNKYEDLSFFPEELESVTLGTACTKENERIIKTFLFEYPYVKLYKLQIKNGQVYRNELQF